MQVSYDNNPLQQVDPSRTYSLMQLWRGSREYRRLSRSQYQTFQPSIRIRPKFFALDARWESSRGLPRYPVSWSVRTQYRTLYRGVATDNEVFWEGHGHKRSLVYFHRFNSTKAIELQWMQHKTAGQIVRRIGPNSKGSCNVTSSEMQRRILEEIKSYLMNVKARILTAWILAPLVANR